MLDIDKIFDNFQVFLNNLEEKDLDTWLAFDKQREQTEKLLSGEIVSIEVDLKTTQVVIIKNKNEYSNSYAGEISYLLAA